MWDMPAAVKVNNLILEKSALCTMDMNNYYSPKEQWGPYVY